MNTKLMNAPTLDFERRAETISARDMPPQMKCIAQLLCRMEHGALRLDLPNGETMSFGDGSKPVTLALRNWNVAAAVLKSGDIGFAESFIDGDWHTDDLPGLIALLIRNRNAAEKLIYGTWWGNLAYRIRHLFNRNTRSGSRKNIHAHYDIGNDFYRLWLDPSMTYSSALFLEGQPDNLEQAQAAKYRRMADELQLAPGARVLEIGCGWGGSFDAIASIEMFEAVGEAYWPSYFDCISRSLKQGGRACVQSIVIDDALFDRYRKGTDFIQQYIFPGGMLPSPSVFRAKAEQHGLQVVNEFKFGLDYARTLAEWRADFHAKSGQVRAQGFDERFMRTWDFYLAYCEAGFRAGSIDVAQFTLVKA